MLLHHHTGNAAWQSSGKEPNVDGHQRNLHQLRNEPACPNQAISAGDNIYLIAQERRTKCVGAFDKPQCVDACPIGDCITVDPAHTESQEILLARYQQLHPN
jgi:Fe-S-cluster-containing hydrogenase component 2